MAKKQTRKPSPASAVATAVMEKLRELDEQRETLMKDAKAEALKAVEAAVAGLNSLGFDYILTKRQSRSPVGGGKGVRTIKDADCPICGFKTDPRHDGRAHRSQKGRKPFTAGELQAKGLQKV